MSAIASADLCLIPSRPSPADIKAAIPTLIAIRRLNRRFVFVLNQTPPRGCRVGEAATSFNSLGVLALHASGNATIIKTRSGRGSASPSLRRMEGQPRKIRGLWRWVFKQLAGESFDHERTSFKAAG
jgi:chromosome partitioning protein